jgi:hypothetical protein
VLGYPIKNGMNNRMIVVGARAGAELGLGLTGAGASGVGGQPARQVGRGLEVEQGNSCGEGCAYGQGFELLQGQGLDLGGSGF